MTTVKTPPIISPVADTPEYDPYRYGWRYVSRTLPDGNEIRERVPLTLEDILHPQEGDFRVHNQDHERFCIYLYYVFEASIANDPAAVVLHDVRVAWANPNIDPHGPDIAVIFGVREQQNWSTFDEKKEGTKPSLIVEVTSPQTRSTDLVDKFGEYGQAGVPYYVIIDSQIGQGVNTRRLLGYQLTSTGYVALPLNEHDRIWLASVRLWLGLHKNEPMCYDETGQPIQDYTTLTVTRAEAEERATEAEERAATEAQARIEAETRLRQLETEIRRLQQENK